MRNCIASSLAAALLALPAVAVEERPNLLGFAQGSLPLRVQADAAAKVTLVQALQAIDGAPTVRAVTALVPSDTRVAFVYELAAPTIFERLLVPGVLETPSPTQTFFREVEVLGSSQSPDSGFERLGRVTLAAHTGKGQVTELALQQHAPVRWVMLTLAQGLDARTPKQVLEFSEIVGHGRQEPVALAEHFGGGWKGRGLALALRQSGALVNGCYDRQGRLEGMVTGRVLHATGSDKATGVRSAFVAAVGGDGRMIVLRSTNGAPFAPLDAARDGAGGMPPCDAPRTPSLGCGSVLHGLPFDFDSSRLRPESNTVLDALHSGLAAASGARVRIEGHTSSEGDSAYNLRLSGQRAQAVVEALVQRGIARTQLVAVGAGETRPIAPNDDETGRAINRRVEVHCAP